MTRRPSREATLRAIGITVVVAIGVVFLLGLWVRHTYGTLDPLVPPPKLNVFGRDYRSSQNKPSTRAGVPATRGGDPADIFEPVIGAWPFVPLWVGSATGYATPTVVWLHVGPDAYQAYSLSGGP